MGKALYRTYRSRALSEVVGQEHITGTLERALKAGRVSHAYLFTGPHGVGKTSVARILAHEINNLPYSDTPHLDIIEIDAASNRRIDDIRDLRDKVHIAPVSAKYKVYIIDEVHMLTGESFNALLKTLEEPPAHAVFILATTEAHKLPATIISRTQRFSFRPGTQSAITAHLKSVAQKEGINIDDDALALIAEHGDGSFRNSLSLLDQLTHVTGGKVTAGDVTGMLGLAPKPQLIALTQATLSGDHQKIAALLTGLEQQGTAPSALVAQLTRVLTEQAAQNPSLYTLIDRLLDVPQAYHPSLKLLTTLVGFAGPQSISMPPQNPPQQPVKNVAQTIAAPAPTSIAEKPAPKPKSKKAKPPADIVELKTLGPKDWNKVLLTAKSQNPPLFAILKQAMPVVQDGALTLTFKFALHSKKLDDAKQKAAVAALLQEVIGTAPHIITAVDKNATPPIITEDPTIAAVTAIMGGGELVKNI